MRNQGKLKGNNLWMLQCLMEGERIVCVSNTIRQANAAMTNFISSAENHIRMEVDPLRIRTPHNGGEIVFTVPESSGCLMGKTYDDVVSDTMSEAELAGIRIMTQPMKKD